MGNRRDEAGRGESVRKGMLACAFAPLASVVSETNPSHRGNV